MSIKTIVVTITESDEAARVVGVALDLAARLDAHLVGVGVKRPIAVPVYSMGAIPDTVLEQLDGAEEERLGKLRDAFTHQVKLADWTSRSDWRVYAAPLAMAVAEAARCADLIVIGQPVDDNVPDDVAMLPGDLVMNASTPILMVPNIGAKPVAGGEALVGWNGGREAARALHDALPMLKLAGKVTLVTVGGDAVVSGEEAAQYLARHDLKVTLQHEPSTELDPGDVLLNLAADRDARLIVIGAYGHSRLREYVLGGSTRTILDHMTVPVVLSR
ncbi:universal stress protein [Oceanibaculum nanhaiense]|uniref:universal stress protein n=1 Tax=Oceanibaculum nanhaiense TaxID=1909734 RepID=UPI003D2C58CE